MSNNSSDHNSVKSNINQSRRDFLCKAGCALAGVGVSYALLPLVSAWMPTETTKQALQPITVDLSHMQPGEMLTVEWNNKPIFILRRTPEMLLTLKHDVGLLRDPESRVDQQPPYARNEYRSLDPTYAVLIGICTHLGCIPQYKQDLPLHNEFDGFYCPCHGSCFDVAGRVFKNVPAPINLAVPPYHFKDQHLLVIGESA